MSGCSSVLKWLISTSPVTGGVISLLLVSEILFFQFFLGPWRRFLGGSAGKESAWDMGDLGLFPGLGRFPGEGKGYPLHSSGLENSMDYSPWGCNLSDMTEWLSLLKKYLENWVPLQYPAKESCRSLTYDLLGNQSQSVFAPCWNSVLCYFEHRWNGLSVCEACEKWDWWKASRYPSLPHTHSEACSYWVESYAESSPYDNHFFFFSFCLPKIMVEFL